MVLLALPLVLGLTLIAAGSGAWLLRRVGCVPEPSAADWPLAAGVGWALVAFATFAFGVLGLLYWHVFALLFGILALLGRREMKKAVSALMRLHRNDLWPAGGLDRVAIVVALWIALITFLACAQPATYSTALTYHLVGPKEFARAHGFTYVTSSVLANLTFSIDVFYTLGEVLGGATVAQALNWALGMTAVAAMTSVAARLFSPRVARIAAALYLTGYHVQRLIPVAIPEGSIPVWTALALVAVVRFDASRDRRWAALAGLFAGLAAGGKMTNAVVGPVMLGGIAWALHHEPARAWVRPVVLYVGVGIVALAPWYARNWAVAGHPFFPLRFSPGATSYWTWVAHEWLWQGLNQPGIRGARTLGELAQALIGATVGRGSYGPLYIAGVPLALLLCRRQRTRVSMLTALALLLGVAFYAESLQPFYAMPAFLVAAPVAALGLVRASDGPAPLRTAAVTALIVGLVLPLTYTRSHVRDLSVVLGLKSRETFLTQRVRLYPAVAWANASLPPTAKVVISPGAGYYLERDHMVVNYLLGLPAVADRIARGDDAGVPAAVKRYGFTHVLWNDVAPAIEERRSPALRVLKALTAPGAGDVLMDFGRGVRVLELR